jgi:hypothetical protein
MLEPIPARQALSNLSGSKGPAQLPHQPTTINHTPFSNPFWHNHLACQPLFLRSFSDFSPKN